MSRWVSLCDDGVMDVGDEAWTPYLLEPLDLCPRSPGVSHGTDSAYHNGCRCDAAREAHRLHSRRVNAEWRAFRTANPWRARASNGGSAS